MQKNAVINDIRGATTLGVLGAVLVPIAFVFVLFSTPRSRSQPIFWIQSFALLLAMSQAAVEIASYHIDIETSGQHPILFYNLCAARESLKWLVPWITDSALIFKLLYFYPRSLCSRRKQLGMIAFPSLIKVPRLTVIIINLVIMCRAFAAQQTTWAAGLKFQVAEIAMQVADNSYCSSILLYKSWKFFNASSSNLHISRTAKAQKRARHIVESIAMSFVPALCIQIAFLVVQAIPGDNAVMLVEAQNYLFIFNVYVSLIFSILATSWSSICNVAESNRAASNMRTLHLTSNGSSSGGGKGAAGHAAFGKGSGGSSEKELPEHRTLLQYLTTTDEVEELSSVSDGNSSEGGSFSRGVAKGDHDMEKGGSSIRSKDSINFSSFFPRRKASHPQGFGGVMMQQDRQRATSPRSSISDNRDAIFHNRAAGQRGPLRLDQYDSSAPTTRIAPFRSPQVPPFKFQDLSRSGSSSDTSARSADSTHSQEDADRVPQTAVIIEQDRLSLDDMLRG